MRPQREMKEILFPPAALVIQSNDVHLYLFIHMHVFSSFFHDDPFLFLKTATYFFSLRRPFPRQLGTCNQPALISQTNYALDLISQSNYNPFSPTVWGSSLSSPLGEYMFYLFCQKVARHLIRTGRERFSFPPVDLSKSTVTNIFQGP